MDPEITGAIIGAGTSVVTGVAGWYLGRRPPKEDPSRSNSAEALKRQHRYDVFISSPLAGLSGDKAIREHHDRIVPLVSYLENELRFRVFWAGQRIRCVADFEAPDISARDDVEAIKDSKYFLLLYPEKVVSSVLFEAGIALRCCLGSIYIAQSKTHLPFLMCSASAAFDNVRTYEAANLEDTLKLVKKHGRRFFEITKADGPCN
jgi:hypothetical protein